MTSVTWIHLAGSGLLRLLPLRKPKRCSFCPLDSCGALEAGRIPSMQYGSLKPETEEVPQPLAPTFCTLHSFQEQLPGTQGSARYLLTIGVFSQKVLGTHDRDFQGIRGSLPTEVYWGISLRSLSMHVTVSHFPCHPGIPPCRTSTVATQLAPAWVGTVSPWPSSHA